MSTRDNLSTRTSCEKYFSSRILLTVFDMTEELGRVNFRKGFWDCFEEREKIGQWLTCVSLVAFPEAVAGRIAAPVPFFVKGISQTNHGGFTRRLKFIESALTSSRQPHGTKSCCDVIIYH